MAMEVLLKVFVSIYFFFPVFKPFAAEISFFQGMALDHGAHGAVEQHDAVRKYLFKGI
jgi:hypothetical protein